MGDDRDAIDKTWDRADFARSAAWHEMDEFLKQCEAAGSPKTEQEREQRDARFLEIQQRCNARALESFKRASSGDAAPHLSVVKHSG